MKLRNLMKKAPKIIHETPARGMDQQAMEKGEEEHEAQISDNKELPKSYETPAARHRSTSN